MQWLFDLFKEWAGVRGNLPPAYVDRGVYSGEFISIISDLNDGLEHVVDFSSIVPEHAKAVVIRLRAECSEADKSIFVVPNGIDIAPGKCAFAITTANAIHREFMIIGVDADRKIKYKASTAGGWANGGIQLRGWIF